MRVPLLAALATLAVLAGCARTPSIDDPQRAAVSASGDAPPAQHAARVTAADSRAAQRPMPATVANAAPMQQAAPAAPPPTGIPGRTRPAPPMSQPLPPEVRPERSHAPTLNTACRADADCAVKNVGSCCGAMPACVNRNSPTDPAAVQADCKARGLMSTCGFRDIHSCSCVSGGCQPSDATATAVDR